jgi:raffinose/stachyose/melibiose transport system substrate-binding protein
MFSDQTGCVVNAETGGAQLNPWADEGLLISLDEVAMENGWLEKDEGGFVTQANLAMPPSSLHEGPEIYGVPLWFQPLGVFYNKDLFEELNLSVPTDFASLEEILRTFKDAGYRPFAFGGAAAGVPLHNIASLLAANVHMDRYLEWWNGTDPNVKFTDPDFLWAAQKLDEWSRADYLSEDPLALSYDDGLGKFLSGEQPMIITGDWTLPRMLAADFEVGYFPIPPNDPEIPWAIVKMGDWPMVVPNSCEYQNQAIEFVNFLTGPETAAAVFEAGLQPVFEFDASGLEPSPLQQEIAEGVQGKLSAFYVDIVDKEVASAMPPAAQLLVDGSLSPEEFTEQVQEAREIFLSER